MVAQLFPFSKYPGETLWEWYGIGWHVIYGIISRVVECLRLESKANLEVVSGPIKFLAEMCCYSHFSEYRLCLLRTYGTTLASLGTPYGTDSPDDLVFPLHLFLFVRILAPKPIKFE